MRITKSQLERIIRESHPRAFVDDILVDYETWVEDNGHITPAASSVVATYIQDRQLAPSGDEAATISQEFGINIRDIHRELERLANEESARRMYEHGYYDDPYEEDDELSQYYDEFPELGKKSEPDRKERIPLDIARQIADEYGDSDKNESFKITKNQLIKIIREAISTGGSRSMPPRRSTHASQEEKDAISLGRSHGGYPDRVVTTIEDWRAKGVSEDILASYMAGFTETQEELDSAYSDDSSEGYYIGQLADEIRAKYGILRTAGK